MELFDKLTDAVKNFDYEGAVESKRASIEHRAREGLLIYWYIRNVFWKTIVILT